jgi:hypothetical protein
MHPIFQETAFLSLHYVDSQHLSSKMNQAVCNQKYHLSQFELYCNELMIKLKKNKQSSVIFHTDTKINFIFLRTLTMVTCYALNTRG